MTRMVNATNTNDTSNHTYIYGFDLSLAKTGIAILDETGRIVHLGNIPTDASATRAERLHHIRSVISDAAKWFQPSAIAIEATFTQFIKAREALDQVQGVVMELFYNVPQFKYSTKTCKAAAAGSGSATKEQVAASLQRIYPSISFNCDDESDALAVAYTHWTQVMNNRR